ncbi:MAG: histone deacetylase [Dehalococcoidales bacterium]
MKAGYVYDPIYLKHETGYHPENAKRLEAVMAHLEKTGLIKQLTQVDPRPATVEELSYVHQETYISSLQDMAVRGGGWLDADTVMSPDSYNAALYAAGGVIEATDAVVSGKVNSAFALVRPPGHHATATAAMGFCLFNNIAIAARHAIKKQKLEKVAIIDFDVHHGNGTQEAFDSDPQVLYISTHQYPHYPGSGTIYETGSGAAQGSKVNIPLPAGSGDDEYRQVFEQIIVPVTKRFRPELILVSAGYDAHWADHLAMMEVSVTGFAQIARFIKSLADELCQGRIVLTLEGGYNLKAQALAVKATFDILLGNPDIEDPLGPPERRRAAPDISELVTQIRKIHKIA